MKNPSSIPHLSKKFKKQSFPTLEGNEIENLLKAGLPVDPGEKPHRIFEDLQGLTKTCQRSLRTRIFKRSLKDL